MTIPPNTPETYEQPPQEYAQPQYAPSAPQPKQKNILGLIAFIVAVVGFVFACIPGALIVGWVLLPIAFILSLVSLFMKGKGKALGIAALILSVVGTLVGVLVFTFVVANSFDEAFGTGETTAVTPAETEEGITGDGGAEPAAEEAAEEAPQQGTRENPYPIGTAITQGDWTVTVNSVNLDATQVMADANMFNEPAPEGSTYIIANVTATYIGTAADGDYPFMSLDYVTPGGNTISFADTMAVAPEPFDQSTTLYEGASTTGNIAIAVPTEGIAEGVLALTPGIIGDKVFVAVQ